MVASLFHVLALNAIVAFSRPVVTNHPILDTTGFSQPSIFRTFKGNAVCVSGTVPVQASSERNVKLNLTDDITSTQAVNLILGLQTANSTLASSVSISEQQISGTFNISAQLCLPSAPLNISSIQFLTHGVGFSKLYWNFGPENSFVDNAAAAGHATFSYDRLGVGNSSHPDPIQVVQGPLEVEIAIELVRMLRQGVLMNKQFDQVIGVGHSYGSALTTSVASQDPSTFDAIVLTGFSSNTTGGIQFTSALNLEVAATVSGGRFKGRQDGYLVPSTQYGVQYAFFRAPDFEDEILIEAFATIETTTIGEQFTMSAVGTPATNFSGPVLLVDGENDLFFCDGNCNYPTNIPAESLLALFPMANQRKSTTFILAGSGHGVNLATNAVQAFDRIQDFAGDVSKP